MVSSPEQRINYVSRGRVNLVALPELTQIVSLDFEQASQRIGPRALFVAADRLIWSLANARE